MNATLSKKSKAKRNTKTGMRFYAMTIGGTPGIWMRHQKTTGQGVVPLFIFVKRAEYSRRFKFYETAQRAAEVHWPKQFRQALKRAIRTAN